VSKQEAVEQLIDKAKKDPKFFHSLVFDAENTIGGLDFLDRREKAMLVALSPDDVFSGLLGLIRSASGEAAVCGYSCEDSCDNTCGGSCFGTCMSTSCDRTCGARSCDVTVELVGPTVTRGDWAGPTVGSQRTFFRSRRRF
jgi:hypothetical protein